MEPNNPNNDHAKKIRAWILAWELGYLIALPIIILALLGRLADKALFASPLFLLLGIFLALIITGFLIWKKVKNLL